MKNAFDGLINRLETAKKRVSKPNKMSKQTSITEVKRDKEMKKNIQVG